MTVFGSLPVLMRDLVVRVIDISESGCLLESRRRIDVGTVGRLQLQLDDEACADDFEVTRCDVVDETRSVYHVGARFLWNAPRDAGSIRHAVTRYADDAKTAYALWVM